MTKTYPILRKLETYAGCYGYWLILFVLQKPLFMLLQGPLLGETTVRDWIDVAYHGLVLDWTVAAYMSTVPVVLLLASCRISTRWIRPIMDAYMGIMTAFCMLAFIADEALYPYWGIRLDKMVFTYMGSVHDVLANAEWQIWVGGVLAWVACTAACYAAYHYSWRRLLRDDETKPKAGEIGVLALCAVLLILPIRGSITVSTMNTGRVFFSSRMQLNIAAINPVFHLFETLAQSTFNTEKYTYMPTAEAAETVACMMADTDGNQQILIGGVKHVVVVILESFSANAVGCLGGTAMTPNIDSIARQGILFTHAYSTGFRTDRGLVGVLACYPNQPTASLMNVPSKSMRLPQFGHVLAEDGYEQHFYYGGDEDFMNMRSLLIAGGYKDRTVDHDFSLKDRLSKWGAPDHVVLRDAASCMIDRTGKQLDVVLTLSSHEPFDVPYAHNDDPYLNSVAYTDSCVGAFYRVLSESEGWDSTLVVLCADHGYPYPAGLLNSDPARNHILMLIAGGAVREPMQIDKICNQCDLMPTVLAQMGLSMERFVFSQNILGHDYKEMSFFSYNDGFVLVTPDDTTHVDGATGDCVRGQHEHEAKAYMQRVYETINELR